MASFFLLASSLLLTGTHAQTYGQTNGISNVSSSACPTQQGAHIIVARASYEPPGYGIIGMVKDNILAQVPGSTAEAVDYPAVIQPNYIESESDGVVAMRQLIANFVEKCSGSPMVLMGYSQGAQVTTDALAGQDTAGFPDNSTIDTPPSESTLARVAAAIVMGDPSHTLNESFSVGNADKDGIFPQKNIERFDTGGLASRMKSYCDKGDPYCAAGGNLTVHLLYVQEYGQQATEFVVDQIKDWYKNSAGGGSGGSGNGTSTPSPSSSPTPYTGAASSVRAMWSWALVPAVVVGGMLAVSL